MNEIQAYYSQFQFNYNRTLGFLKQLEESPVGMEALYWRMPFGNGRAHIGWQFLHLSATYHKFGYFVEPSVNAMDEDFVKNFGHGSIPDEKIRFTFDELKGFLQRDTNRFWKSLENFPIDELDRKPQTTDRTFREMILLMNWHECIHIGQSQITWNAFRASRGLIV